MSKRKPDDPPSGSTQENKRRVTRWDKAKAILRPEGVRIRLSDKTKICAGLTNPELLNIPNIAYLDNIADNCEYLYDLVSRICDVDIGKIKLYNQTDGRLRDETDAGWLAVDTNTAIDGGIYLCVIPEGIASGPL
jgi:hypothetical protein